MTSRIEVATDILNIIDDIKDKLTDSQYQVICTKLHEMSLRRQHGSIPDPDESPSCSRPQNQLVHAYDRHSKRYESTVDVNTGTYLLCPKCATATEKIHGCSDVLCVCGKRFQFVASHNTYDNPIPTGIPLLSRNRHIPFGNVYSGAQCNVVCENLKICRNTRYTISDGRCHVHKNTKFLRLTEEQYNEHCAIQISLNNPDFTSQ